MNERERLKTLHALSLLDTPPDPQFENITQMASKMFDVPIVLVSLVDENRQWFKSNCGLEGVTETPRDVAFCHYTIQENDVLIIPDSTKDKRFSGNPLVTGQPDIRFYAGAPLKTKSGATIGTLCLIDRKPREMKPHEIDQLKSMAAVVVSLIEKHAMTLDLQQMAQEAQEQKNLLQSLFEASMAGIIHLEAVFDDAREIIDFKIISVNSVAAQAMKLPIEEIFGKSLLEVAPSVRELKLFLDYSKAIKTQQAFSREVHHVEETSENWYFLQCQPVNQNRLTVTFIPLTERKRFEIAIHELREVSSLASEDLPAYIAAVLEVGARTLEADEGYVSNIVGMDYNVVGFFGENPAIGIGDVFNLEQTICEVIAKTKQPHSFWDIRLKTEEIGPVIESGPYGSYIGAPIYVNADFYGTISFVGFQARDRVYSDYDLELIGILSGFVSRAIELNLAFKKLNSLNMELRNVLDSVPAKIWYKDDKNNILRVNSAALKSVGLTDSSEVEGKNTSELYPDMADKYHRDDLKVIESGKPLRNIIEPYVPAEGETGWVSTDKIPLDDEEGNKYILVVASDITELKLKEEQLVRLNDSLSDFAFVASHDLQAPLRQSAMFVDLLKEQLEEASLSDGEEINDYLNELDSGIRHMRALVRSLYDLFKLNSEKITKEPVQVDTAIKLALKQLKSFIDERGAKVEIGALPTLNINLELFVQLFQNFITNACKYAEVSELNIKIYSDQDIRNRKQKIIIEDNGIGIPLAFQSKIFEPFKRLHHSDQVEGAGIGLALCKKILALHDGDLYVDPDYNDGARFVLAINY